MVQLRAVLIMHTSMLNYHALKYDQQERANGCSNGSNIQITEINCPGVLNSDKIAPEIIYPIHGTTYEAKLILGRAIRMTPFI